MISGARPLGTFTDLLIRGSGIRPLRCNCRNPYERRKAIGWSSSIRLPSLRARYHCASLGGAPCTRGLSTIAGACPFIDVSYW